MLSEPIVVPAEYVSLAPIILPNKIYLNQYTEYIHQKRFVSKVYTILWFQLLFTFSYIGLCNQYKPLQLFYSSQLGVNLIYCCMLLLLLSSCFLFCLFDSIRQFPYNYLYLSGFTILITYPLGIFGVLLSSQTLLLSILSTTGIFTGLTIYSYQTKINYTMYGNILIILLYALFMFGIFIPFFHIPILYTIYSVGGAVLFSFYIVYDTQLIINCKNRELIYTVDDYVIAAVNLYLDFINLFIFMIDIIGGRN